MREKWKQWQILFSWAPESLWTLTAATKLKDTCSLEGRKAMKNLYSVLKSRDSLCHRGLQCQAMIFPVIMYRSAIWTIRKGEYQRIELLKCGAWEDSWESLIHQGDQTSQSERKSTSDPCYLIWGVHWGVQVERTEASTAKVPNHGNSKQILYSSTPGGRSERLKALCTLGPMIHALHSPQQHWRPRKGHSGPWRREMAQGSTETTTYQEGLKRHKWQRAGGWGVGTRGNQLCMKYLTQNPSNMPSNTIIWDGMKRVYFITPYNSSEWGGGGVCGSSQTLPWPRQSPSLHPWGCLSPASLM